MKPALPLVLAIALAGCAVPSDTAPANDVLGTAGVAMDIDTIGAENMESAANLSVTLADMEADPGPDDARSIVASYYEAIAARRYDRAYALWEPGAMRMDAAVFAASFGKYKSYVAEVGVPGRVDAGAGQRYVSVPVRISAIAAEDDEPISLTGAVTLHRVAQIDGASAAQRRWRIREATIGPQGAAAPALIRADYRCEDDAGFSVVFDNKADTATVTFAGEPPVILAGQRPASGIWYAGDRWELRGKGDAATLTRPGAAPIECSVPAAAESGGAGDGAEGDEAR